MKALAAAKIAFIGAGNMGSALIHGLVKSVNPDRISVYDPDPSKISPLPDGINNKNNSADASHDADIVVFAVKPDQTILAVEKSSLKKNALIISVAAGITISSLEMAAGSDKKIIRAMPNTPAVIGRGMTVLCHNSNIDDESAAAALELFSASGRAIVLSEKLMDAVTGLSGSGPGFVFTFIQALADGGVKMGIPRKESVLLAAQTVLGAAEMVLEGMGDPCALRGMVTSPGGTTIDGIHILERGGFAGLVMDAVEAAALKSKRLGGN